MVESSSLAVSPWPRAGRDIRQRQYPCLQERLVGTSISKCLRLSCYSIGWDGVTAALQLVSHLKGDALNVALLVPASWRVMPGVLLDTLSEHYSSPGKLADYRRRFERISRRPGDDLSVFAVELETLAMRAFGDLSS